MGTNYGQEVNCTTGQLKVGDAYQGKTVYCPNPLKTFMAFARLNWYKAKKLADSLGGKLPTRIELQNELFIQKDLLKLDKHSYLSSEQVESVESWVWGVIFNSSSHNGETIICSKDQEVFVIVVFY